jgi:hypothetical protein
MAGAAHAQRASTFQLSCTEVSNVGNTLSAKCRRLDGSFVRSTILIPSVENIDGDLRFTGAGQPSTYQDTCLDAGIVGNRLFARCRRIDGGFNRATILVPGIENADGVLRYR